MWKLASDNWKFTIPASGTVALSQADGSVVEVTVRAVTLLSDGRVRLHGWDSHHRPLSANFARTMENLESTNPGIQAALLGRFSKATATAGT